MSKKVALIILDGWGEGPETDANAIFKAKTPFVDSLYARSGSDSSSQHPNAIAAATATPYYSYSQLLTSGENVGLPDGQMGNSEVGHLNIGAGRIVYQDLVKINLAVRDRSFHRHPVILEAINY